jgi:exodeoxyribonuclease VII large subunit
VDVLERRLHAGAQVVLARVRRRVEQMTSHRVFAAEQGRVRQHAQRVDDLMHRAERATKGRFDRNRDRLRSERERLESFRWDRQLARHREALGKDVERLGSSVRALVADRRGRFARLAGKLDSLSPLSVLSRGYALVWDERRGGLVRRAADLSPGDPLRIRVHDGDVRAVVAKENE